jgi:hypothetical protein
MMYFSRLKTTLILGVCLLGILLGVPNLFPAPAAWIPWRTVHLGLGALHCMTQQQPL